MIEPEIKSYLERFDQRLQAIQYKKQGIWRSFFLGVFSALGYVAGLAIVIVILGWFLQKTGLWPAFKQQMQNFADVINQAKKFTAPENQNSNSEGGGTFVGPDGKTYKINVSQ